MNTQAKSLSALRERFLSPDEAASLLGKKTTTLAKWRSAAQGPAFVKVGGSVRYLPEDLEAFIAAGRCAPAAQAVG